jgi:PAS domain S-box-containing protein
MPSSTAGIRPLSAPDRWRRIWPFVGVAGLGYAMAWLPPGTDGTALLAAVAIGVLLLAAVVFIPWARLPADFEALPALAFFVVVVVLREGTGGPASGFSPLAMLPILWLALYHGLAAVTAGMGMLALTFAVPLALGETDWAQWRRGALMLAVAGVLSAAVHGRMTRSRRYVESLGRDRDFTTAVLDGAGLLVVVASTDASILVFNRRCEALTGMRAEDVVGRPLWSIYPGAEVAARVRAMFERLDATAFPASFESDWTGADGVRRRIVWSITALVDETGAVTHVIGAGLDVTDQRHTERLFADVLGAATEQAIIATNSAGTVTVFNAGAERLLGYDADDVIGLVTLDRFVLPEELDGQRDALYAPAREGSTEARQRTYVRKDGDHVPVALTVSAMRDEVGAITGYLGVARDITQERRTVEAMAQALELERAAATRLRELDKVRSDLVATVSHELRTPLTSILGNVEILVDGDAGPMSSGQTRLAAAVERNARRLLALIEDLLMLSRIESGAVKINARPVLIRAVVSGALEVLENVRGERKVALAVELPDEPMLVHGDRAQLERVVINLVDNALKFTPSGGQARVSVEAVDDRQVRLTVADTGMGIPEDEIDHIFEQFFRSSRSQERQSQGTGLGLAITKSIVERHGGRIWARPAEGTGTVVTCLLPRPPR